MYLPIKWNFYIEHCWVDSVGNSRFLWRSLYWTALHLSVPRTAVLSSSFIIKGWELDQEVILQPIV